jgi:hypothetical protein
VRPADVTPADVLTAIRAGWDTAHGVAAYLGVAYPSGTLRLLLDTMVADGVLAATPTEPRHFTIEGRTES